jgi:NADPH-dependent glutamate synthase beta subunit-like oxidoreductase
VPFLRDVAGGARPTIGRRVAVYGGGNTAMDAARVARRLGAQDTMIVYRRNRERMPAHEQEAAEAEQEGVRINWLRTITAFEGPELTVEVMELDEEGRPQPTGRLETLAADTIIMAVGQDADTAFLHRARYREGRNAAAERDGSAVPGRGRPRPRNRAARRADGLDGPQGSRLRSRDPRPARRRHPAAPRAVRLPQRRRAGDRAYSSR